MEPALISYKLKIHSWLYNFLSNFQHMVQFLSNGWLFGVSDVKSTRSHMPRKCRGVIQISNQIWPTCLFGVVSLQNMVKCCPILDMQDSMSLSCHLPAIFSCGQFFVKWAWVKWSGTVSYFSTNKEIKKAMVIIHGH